MKNIIILSVVFFSLISCSKKEIDYVYQIDDDNSIPKIKLSLNVYISKRIDISELKIMADEIYDRYDGKTYENVFIEYLLPRMEPGNGCYATSNYQPNQELTIIGLTNDDLEKIKSKFSIKRYWIDDSWKMLLSIDKEKNKYYLKKYASDFSTGKSLLYRKVKDNDTIYKIPDAIDGAYYVVKSNNDLAIFDKQGYINSFLNN
jgi:hypothetical protein